MKWFSENKFLGGFLIALSVLTLGAVYFLLGAIGEADDASSHFDQTAAESTRLQELKPAPNEANVQKMKVVADNYAAAIEKLKKEVKTHELPIEPMAPNEFQTRLRQAVTTISDKAKAAKVKLPDNFYLGFDDFASSLPNTAAAPLLGQELKAVEVIVNIAIDAHVDALTSLTRTPIPEEHGSAAAATPVNGPAAKTSGKAGANGKLIIRHPVELAFTASLPTARRVINQISSSKQQFLILRTVNVRNEKDKGPTREQPGDPSALGGASPAATPATPAVADTSAPSATGGATPVVHASILNFIVGNERIDLAVSIDVVNFNF